SARQSLEHDDLGADFGPPIEVRDVDVDQPDAAGRDIVADRPGLARAVDAILRVALGVEKIKGAGPERVVGAALHERGDDAAMFALAPDRLGRRPPVGPFLHPSDVDDAVPAEALAPDADAVADRLVLAGDVEEIVLAGIDDDGARRFLGRESHLLPLEFRG